jgi:hypothetical protein
MLKLKSYPKNLSHNTYSKMSDPYDRLVTMKTYNCSDCQRLIRPENLYGHKLDNVCGRCYAIRVQHPSTYRQRIGEQK